MVRPLATLLVLGSCAFGASACDIAVDAHGFTTRDEKRFTVRGTPELTLATFDGTIEVRRWDRPEVLVVIERRGQTRDDAESIDIAAEQSGNRISVEARRPRHREIRIGFGLHLGRSAKLIASVPRTTNLLARSGDGSIVAAGLDGRVELRTADGAVRGEHLKGQLRVHTGDGNIKVSDLDGAVDLDTRDGAIDLDGRLTALHVRTGDGGIVMHARRGSAMSDDWDVSTGDGSVDLELPDGFDAEVDAHTGDGSIDVSRLALTMRGDVRRDTVRGRLGSGGPRLKVRSADGSIRLSGAMLAERTDQR